VNLAEYSINKSLFTWVVAVLLVAGGVLAYQDMGRLEDPEFTIKDAVVVTPYPGATPLEVSEEVADELEQAIQQLPQLKEIRNSMNIPGMSVIELTIKDQYDKDTLPQVWDELRRKVNDAQRKLPPGAGPSIVNDDFGDVYGLLYAITAEDYSYAEIKELSDFLRKQLLLVPGVAKITVYGEQQEAVFVEMSRARMARLGISTRAVFETLQERNLVSPAGEVKVGPEYIRITPSGEVTDVADLGELLISDPASGSVTRLKGIAEIRRGYVTPPGEIARFDGKKAVVVGVSMVPGENVVELGKAVDARLAELMDMIPVGMEFHKVFFQPEYVVNAVDSFLSSLLMAVGIVIVVLLFFMGLRSGLIIGAVLVITIAGTFIFMDILDIDLQRVSLGALVVALGMLVDNAIVVTEGMLIRIQQGKDRVRSAIEVAGQSAWPLLGATVIAVLAFAAIGVSQDATGEYLASLFQVMLISLMLSWVTALTITPLLCKRFLPGPKAGEEDKDPYRGIIFTAYKRLLTFFLHFRVLALGLMALMMGAAIYGFGLLPGGFFPDSTQPRFYIHYWLPQGTDICETSADMREIEERLLADGRVKSVSSFVGAGAPRFTLVYGPEKANSSYGLLFVEVDDYRRIDAMIGEYRQYLAANYPQAEPKFKKMRLGPGTGASIEARFSGPDPTVLRELSERAKAVMRADPHAVAVRDDWRQKVKVIRPVISETQMRRAGIDRRDVNQALMQAFTGTQVGVYREGDLLLPIISRPPDDERLDAANITSVQIFSPVAGGFIPLTQVVSGFETVLEDGIIRHRDRIPTITASCEPDAGEQSVLFERLRPEIEAITLPQGYSMEWGGEHESAKDAQTALFKNIPVTVVLMILITIALFNNLRQPLIIWLTVPLAVVGVSLGLIMTNQPFGFMALLGFLSLSGMLIKNAIVLIDQINIELAEGKAPYKAVVDASVSRMRPVFMAAGTTVLGMIPLLTDVFFMGMAVTIMFGLTFASLLTLFAVPVFYSLFYGVKREE